MRKPVHANNKPLPNSPATNVFNYVDTSRESLRNSTLVFHVGKVVHITMDTQTQHGQQNPRIFIYLTLPQLQVNIIQKV